MSFAPDLHAPHDQRPKSDPLIIGHRGASGSAPENTLAAFALAFEEGADGVEFDVRLARDGVPVVIHDATLDRTARRAGRVSGLTSNELSGVDVGTWFNLTSRHAARESFERERVPTLAQVFELIAEKARAVYVELKFESAEAHEPLVARVVEEIRRHRLEDRAVVESFRLEAVKSVRRVAPDLCTAALFERTLSKPLPSPRRIIEQAVECGANELALQSHLVSDSLIRAAGRAGLRALAWTVDEPSWAMRARELGLCAIITNQPAVMRASLGRDA